MDKNLLRYKGSKKVMAIITMLVLVQAIAILFQSVYLAKAIVAMYKGEQWKNIFFLFTVFFLALAVRQGIQWFKSKVAYRFAEQTSSYYQDLLLEKMFALGPRVVRKEGSGNMITLCLEGVPQFRTYLELFVPRIISFFIIPFVIFIYTLQLDKLSALILVIVLPILMLFFVLLGWAAEREKNRKMASYKILANHFVDSLRGLVTLKFLGRSKQHRESIASVSEKYRKATIRTLRIAFLSTFSLDFFSTLSVAVISVFLGLRLIEGEMSLLPALTVLILAPEYFNPVKDLSNDYHATMDGLHAGKMIHRFLEEETAADDTDEQAFGHWDENSVLSLQGIEKHSAEEKRNLLSGIDLTITGFKKIGVIGLSGAGKSTLINILAGFDQPTKGKIIVNGVELSHLTYRNWQRLINYIPQHPYIFSGTVLDNIRFYTPDATEEEVKEAVRLAGLDPVVAEFSEGLQEKIGQGGRMISGGEEQRIALARALLDPRPILILDEPTAHLDIETEHDIKSRMLPFFKNKLVILATHRLHWMRIMDEIIVLDQGKIVERGTHEELLQKRGKYWQLVKAHQGGEKVDTVSKVYTSVF